MSISSTSGDKPPENIVDTTGNVSKKIKVNYAVPLNQMIQRVQTEPPMKMVYSGIKEQSVGFVFGPSKSAKTIYCENLGMSIAAGFHSYLGLPISISNRKVLFISLEEFYAGRTQRNQKQVEKISASIGDHWLENYIVVNEHMPRYLITDNDWRIVYDLIREHQPGIVFLDSLTRSYEGSIEDSATAKEVMKKLRELSNDSKTTITCIHHSPKLYNSALTISSLAGSRIIAQDADFMIGLNKTLDNRRYIKNVAFRYAPDDSETVTMFTIDDSLWLTISGAIEEATLLNAMDGRRDDANKLKLLDFITEKSESKIDRIVTYAEIESKFVTDGTMSGQTAHTHLKKLIQEGKIIKLAKGQYQIVQ